LDADTGSDTSRWETRGGGSYMDVRLVNLQLTCLKENEEDHVVE
jgi:hypothetical protein